MKDEENFYLRYRVLCGKLTPLEVVTKEVELLNPEKR